MSQASDTARSERRREAFTSAKLAWNRRFVRCLRDLSPLDDRDPRAVIDEVDPFIGVDVTDLPSPTGLAATWWSPKPPVGNTHPGAASPFGMVSACAYSGAYPTGYGLYDKGTEGLPTAMHDSLVASGITHFQQSGTGAIRKYYNYFRVTPMLEPLDELGRLWQLRNEEASPGYYRADLSSGIGCEVTVGPKTAVHRYTFPASRDARIVIDFSSGGLAIDHGETVPTRAELEVLGNSVVRGEVVVEGVPLAVHIECHQPGWRQMLWYDRRLMTGARRLDFDSIRQTTLRPFGSLFRGSVASGDSVEIRIGFSLRGVEQAEANLRAELDGSGEAFGGRLAATRTAWEEQLSLVEVDGGSADQRTTFATALYHSLVKPCFAEDESPFWSSDGPFVFDICTMWDIYKTQLPLLLLTDPDRARDLMLSLMQVSAEEGNLPIGYRMARGADRFFRQASALAHTFLADAAAAELPDVDWEWAVVHMHNDLRRNYGEEYLDRGLAHPVSHTLDIAYGYHCTAQVARAIDDHDLAEHLDGLATRWVNAFDPADGLLIDSTFYEGGRWNYSFRLLHDMAARIELSGGEEAFVAQLDRFFGFGAEPVKQLGAPPFDAELAAGYALDRFEGLNNEPDIEAPWAYHYAGRPDRTAEIVHAILQHQFGVGRGGLPGNDDSGGLSSWYVWASLGLFPVAGQDLFLLHPPAFERSTMATPSGRLEILTEGFEPRTPGSEPQYVVGVRLDDTPLDRAWLSGVEIRRATTLVYRLGPAPSVWASDSRPPSQSTRVVPFTPTNPQRSFHV